MRIIITGGAGFLGKRLALTLLKQDQLVDMTGKPATIEQITVFDLVAPSTPLSGDSRLKIVSGNITDPQVLGDLIKPDTDLIFHLAAVVSGEAEENFDLGLRVNLLATQHLLETCRRLKSAPRLVFTSSVAVFGGQLPDVIEDHTAPTPQSSYGMQKAVCELLINDYSRKGFIDGRVVRLPTIVVRPGKPNKATSTFASSIIREPLQGQATICPVSPDLPMWIMSPRKAAESLIRAAELPADAWGHYRALSLPGLTVTIQEMVEGLRHIAGQTVAERICWQPDPFIEQIVGSWPARFAPTRALAMGFEADPGIIEIIQAFIDDELGGSFVS